MKSTIFRPVSCLLGLAALTIVSSTLSARAETPSSNSNILESESVQATNSVSTSAEVPSTDYSAVGVGASEPTTVQTETSVSTAQVPVNSPSVAQNTEDTTQAANQQQVDFASLSESQADFSIQGPTTTAQEQQTASDAVEAASSVAQTNLEASEASATSLSSQPAEANTEETDASVAQRNFDPGPPTRGGESYIGVGLNIGVSDDGTPLGDTGFVINSKLGLNRNLSFRPSVILANDAAFLLPVTYDFVLQSSDPFEPALFAPFIGGGPVISTGNNNNFGVLLTAGVDLPISRALVANGTVNLGFIEGATDVGVVVGIGYTFSGF
ncbi:hypothetical protein [Lyngbya aestuarii]|uniref:hypothetical protein n=1 Tax=Lyngbya aestuarii TaxID=118322 RepID=UPI00403DC7FC